MIKFKRHAETFINLLVLQMQSKIIIFRFFGLKALGLIYLNNLAFAL